MLRGRGCFAVFFGLLDPEALLACSAEVVEVGQGVPEERLQYHLCLGPECWRR